MCNTFHHNKVMKILVLLFVAITCTKIWAKNTLQTNKKSLMLLITANNSARGLPKGQAFEPYQKPKPKWEVND